MLTRCVLETQPAVENDRKEYCSRKRTGLATAGDHHKFTTEQTKRQKV
jgi:hypothetical protein